jgi:hypothetical protein
MIRSTSLQSSGGVLTGENGREESVQIGEGDRFYVCQRLNILRCYRSLRGEPRIID